MHAILYTGKTDNIIDQFRRNGTNKIATILRKMGWDVDVVDYITLWSDVQLLDFLSNTIRQDTKLVGVSHTFLGSNISRHLISETKKFVPDIVSIVGGQLPYDEDIGADYYIFGYAETAIEAVINYHFNNVSEIKAKPFFSGMYIDTYHSYPAWPSKSYRTEYLDHDFITSNDVLTIELSRGCRFSCKFCSFPLIGMKDDTSVDEESIYEELNTNYQKYGVTNYIIADDTFNDRTIKIQKLVNVVKKLDFTPNFCAFIRIDLLYKMKEQLELLGEARVISHYYGVETFNHDAGKVIGKGLHPDKVKETLTTVREYYNKNLGMYLGTIGMIVGLPFENLESVDQSKKWLIDNWDRHGLSIKWWPLTIDIGYNNHLSAFGLDLSKYGYRLMKNIPSIDENLNENSVNRIAVRQLKDRAFWENDHMNVIDAINYVNSIKLSNKLFTWSAMNNLAFNGRISDAYSLKDKLLTHISRYIDSKIEYSKSRFNEKNF